MPGSGPNHLAHQQPHAVMRRAAGFLSQPPDHSPKSAFRLSRGRARRSRQTDIRANEVSTLKKLKVYVVDVEATPSRSEAG
eukprot:1498276-Pleurochrysis_carterae.AAC.1